MDDGGRHDAGLARPNDVDRAVVHQHVHAELGAAADLVEGAVQVVVGQADLLEPAGRGDGGLRPAVTRHVDPVAALVPSAHGLDGTLVGHSGGDVLVGMRLLDAVDHGVALERSDAPLVLLLVGQLDAVALSHDALEQVPVVVQGRVDIERDSGHGLVQ